MIRIYTRNGHHDVPDTLLQLLGQIVAQSNSPVDVVKNATYTDIHESLLPEIDETEAVPVLSDEPEDPEITIERLNARILELEAELEERRRSTDAVLEALRPLGTIVIDQAGVSSPETSTEGVKAFYIPSIPGFNAPGPSIPAGMTGKQYFEAKAELEAQAEFAARVKQQADFVETANQQAAKTAVWTRSRY